MGRQLYVYSADWECYRRERVQEADAWPVCDMELTTFATPPSPSLPVKLLVLLNTYGFLPLLRMLQRGEGGRERKKHSDHKKCHFEEANGFS